jgi:hypothetical protein
MCEILEVFYLHEKEKAIITCSRCEGDFFNAKALKVIYADGSEVLIKEFVMERHTNCFSFNEDKPWIVVDAEVGRKFFKVGSKIKFLL